MIKSIQPRFALITLIALAAMGSLVSSAQGQAIEGFPLTAQSFARTGARGFGDRNNSWAQGIVWWNNNLYVGTSRQSICTSLYGVYEYIVKPTFGEALANQFFPIRLWILTCRAQRMALTCRFRPRSGAGRKRTIGSGFSIAGHFG